MFAVLLNFEKFITYEIHLSKIPLFSVFTQVIHTYSLKYQYKNSTELTLT